MKTFVSFLLILLFATHAFRSFVLDAAFVFNQNYVAQTLCVNQSQPQLHCNGKCYLSKQIQSENKNESGTNTTKKEMSDAPYFFPANNYISITISSSETFMHNAFYGLFLHDYFDSLLKPPRYFLV